MTPPLEPNKITVRIIRLGNENNPALIGLLATILIAGPGRFSLSHYLTLPKAAHPRSRAFE